MAWHWSYMMMIIWYDMTWQKKLRMSIIMKRNEAMNECWLDLGRKENWFFNNFFFKKKKRKVEKSVKKNHAIINQKKKKITSNQQKKNYSS